MGWLYRVMLVCPPKQSIKKVMILCMWTAASSFTCPTRERESRTKRRVKRRATTKIRKRTRTRKKRRVKRRATTKIRKRTRTRKVREDDRARAEAEAAAAEVGSLAASQA